MIELAQEGETWHTFYGGDTLNTAIHLARAGVETAYLTALGRDAFSVDMRQKWADEGIETSLILTDPSRLPGLYAISTDEGGERSFSYWRSDSAARGMFDCAGIDAAIATAERAELLAFSLISLAILPKEGLERLLAVARAVRERGGIVAFDGNYRPHLWPSPQDAIAARDAAIGIATIGLPTLEDEAALSKATDAAEVAAHWQALGCQETVVKLGAEGCRLPDGSLVAPDAVLNPVDTSGAGDAFNGGYLAARLAGAPPAEAARQGHKTAAWTIMRRGAIPPPD